MNIFLISVSASFICSSFFVSFLFLFFYFFWQQWVSHFKRLMQLFICHMVQCQYLVLHWQSFNIVNPKVNNFFHQMVQQQGSHQLLILLLQVSIFCLFYFFEVTKTKEIVSNYKTFFNKIIIIIISISNQFSIFILLFSTILIYGCRWLRLYRLTRSS